MRCVPKTTRGVQGRPREQLGASTDRFTTGAPCPRLPARRAHRALREMAKRVLLALFRTDEIRVGRSRQLRSARIQLWRESRLTSCPCLDLRSESFVITVIYLRPFPCPPFFACCCAFSLLTLAC